MASGRKNTVVSITNFGGLNLYVNPLEQPAGAIYRAVNVDSFPLYAKKKRQGYTTFLGATDGSAVKDLWSWNNNGTLNLYKNSGTQIMYSAGGTGAWTSVTNGQVNGTAHVGHIAQGSVMLIGDGLGSTRFTNDGVGFTNATLAPVSSQFEQYQTRAYALGAVNLFYSNSGDLSSWGITPPDDSSSFIVPGEGSNIKVLKLSDRIFATKSSGNMFRWDGNSLTDLATSIGPSSPYSYGTVEDNGFYLNRLGVYTSNGGKPTLISNPVERLIYNDSGSAILGTNFDTAPGVVHKYDYLVQVGTVTDDFSNQTINDCILKYNYQKNEWLTWSFANAPTAWCSYKDAQGNQQLIFGDKTGQVYQMSGTATSDNGNTIEVQMEGFIHLGTLLDKEWNWFRASFNPGCGAKLSIAVEDTFTKENKDWHPCDAIHSGVFQYKFKQGERSKYLFWKISEASRQARLDLYGFEVDADIISAG